jgi:hypothetical protein
MMEATRTCETSVNFYQITWRNTPEDSHLHGSQTSDSIKGTQFLYFLSLLFSEGLCSK